MKPYVSPLARGLLACAVVLLVVGLTDAALHDVFAQNPFGAPKQAPAAEPEASGLIGWLLAKQSEFYRQLSGLIRAAKVDGSASARGSYRIVPAKRGT